MKLFLVLTSAYFAICLGVVLITPGVGIAAFEGVWARAMSLVPALANAALGLFCLAVLARRFGRGRKTDGPRGLGALGSAIAMALVGTVLLQAGFLMFKTTMPSIVPFFADPPLAQWDKVLHGGTDAWVWTFAAAAICRWTFCRRRILASGFGPRSACQWLSPRPIRMKAAFDVP